MNFLNATRRNNAWFNLLLFIISFTFLIVWLPLIRSICDGTSYQWGTNLFGISISGAGISLSLFFVIAQFLFYMALFFSFYWFSNRYYFKLLVILWYVMIFGNMFFDIIKNGDTMFHGDTLNVHVSLTNIIVPLGIIALGFILMVFRKDASFASTGVNWNWKNTKRFIILFGPVPVQAILFATGEPHGITDQIGVVLAITQALMVPLIVRPYK